MGRVHTMGRPSLASCLLLLLLISTLTQFSAIPPAEAKKEKTHYEVLELKEDASLKDIKKAYRSLAVKHHPDRNLGNEEEATIKFREISEAYEILSDEDSRREYDRALKRGESFGSGSSGWSYGTSTGDRQQRRDRRRHRDPFDQFNDLFKNDPFFKDAFKSMDDLFDRHFSNDGGSNSGSRKTYTQQSDTKVTVDSNNGAGGWIWNKVKDYLPDVNVEIKTSTSTGGSTSYSSSSRSYSSSGSRRSSSSSTSRGGSSYTSRSTRTVIENGKRVTIQSLEKDGNKIEEKYIGEKLIERTINGMKDNTGMIDEF